MASCEGWISVEDIWEVSKKVGKDKTCQYLVGFAALRSMHSDEEETRC